MSKIKDGVIGHVIGDAMGVPIEFSVRDRLLKEPVTTMLGYQVHNVPAGTWSDDTSMEIATMDSIIHQKKIDSEDIMKNFYAWLNDGKYTPHGEVFDIGATCRQAIYNFARGEGIDTCGERDEYSNGNGSLMRILPIAYYCYYQKLPEEEIYMVVKEVSSLTHAHEISVLGCYIYVLYVINLLHGKDKFESYAEIKKANYSMFSKDSIEAYSRILKENIQNIELSKIKSNGYVVCTLEASLWVILHSEDYQEAIIGAINLGNDTDTIGAITGSIAGILYGYDKIPKEWLEKLVKRTFLEELCDEFEKTIT